MKKIIAAVAVAGMSVSLFALDLFSVVPLKGSVKSYTVTDYSISSKFGDYFRTPETKFTHVLNASGFATESSELTARDVLANKITNTYNDVGKLVGQVAYSGENQLIWKNTITYNDD